MHPDFQAPAHLALEPARRRAPARRASQSFAASGMDAGKAVAPHRPIRPGTKITGKTHLHDVYTKTGRSGRMVFMVNRMELFDEAGRAAGDHRYQHRHSGEAAEMSVRECQHHTTSSSVRNSGVRTRHQRSHNVKRFAVAARWNAPRFTDHEAARKEGLPGALVPGIMSQGFLAAMIHRWAPDAEITNVDTVFRAPVIVDERLRHQRRGNRRRHRHRRGGDRLDRHQCEAGETRVFGTANARLPTG